MSTPLLVLGTSPDGPDGIVTTPLGWEDLVGTFSPPVFDTIPITATSTGATLSQPAWGSYVKAYTYNNGLELVPFYNLSASGNQITFGSTGSSGTFLFSYYGVPGEGDIVEAVRELITQGVGIPQVCRIPGVNAFLDLDVIYLQAVNSGSKYNGILVSSSGNILSIIAPNTLGQQEFIYSFDNVFDLELAINKDAGLGNIPIAAQAVVPSATSISTGLFVLDGGMNANIDGDTISNFLSVLDLNGIVLVLIAPGLDSNGVASIQNFIGNPNGISSLPGFPDTGVWAGFPTLFVVGSPLTTGTILSSGGISSSDYEAALLNLGATGSTLFFVPGWFNHTGYLPDQQSLLSLSTIFAGLWTLSSSPPTHRASNLGSLIPAWTTDQLHALGPPLCPFTRFIHTGFSPWWSGPCDGEDPVDIRVKSIVAQRIFDLLDPLLGKGQNNTSQIQVSIDTALQNIPGVRSIKSTVTRVLDSININVDIIRYGEVRGINLNLSTRRY